MNISTHASPIFTLVYVFILLWILMGVDLKSFRKAQRWLILAAITLLCVTNEALHSFLDPQLYSKLLLLHMHLPMFLLFLYIAKCGVIKTGFMILTALVFSAPTSIVGNILHNHFSVNDYMLLLSSILTYGLMLLLAYFVFRSGFNYLLKYGNTRFFLLFSLVPLVYYVYIFAYSNLDISSLTNATGFLVRLLPNLQVFVFYFLLPYIYKTLNEKQIMKSAQNALQQRLVSTQDQIALLNETNTQMAVYRHDMRHQLIMLNGLLTSDKTQQAREFVKSVMSDLDAITPQKFCENETVNLLCSSYDSKARRTQVRFTVEARLPMSLPLSDTELCSVVANGLENALHAASRSEVTDKWVEFYGEVRQNKLFLQIRNSYAGRVVIDNGLPLSDRDGHGYGCRSIQSVAQHNAGLCSFEAEDGVFTLRVMIPLPAEV